VSVPEYCRVDRVSQEFEGLISLLRFYRMSGHLYMVDRFANTINAQDALGIVREMLSLVSRQTPRVEGDKRYCFWRDDVTDEREAMWYKNLGADVKPHPQESGKWIVRVPCPYLPSDEELRKFSECVDRGFLKPSTVAVYAYTPHGR
jgi:hypothetical protein